MTPLLQLELGPRARIAGAPCTRLTVQEGPRALGFWVPDAVAERVRDHAQFCGCAPKAEEVAFLMRQAVTPRPGDDRAPGAPAALP